MKEKMPARVEAPKRVALRSLAQFRVQSIDKPILTENTFMGVVICKPKEMLKTKKKTIFESTKASE